MALDDHLVAAVTETVADVAAHLGVRVVDVHVVHAAVKGGGHELTGGGGVDLLEASAAEADDPHAQAGAAERAVLHVGVLHEFRGVLLVVAGCQQQCRAQDGETHGQDSVKFSHNVIIFDIHNF